MQSKCPRNELANIFSISKVWNELYKPRKKRKTSPKPLASMDGRGIKDLHKCGEEMSKNSSLPSQEQQETSELNGSSGGREGDKGAKDFCPCWRHQPGQKGGPFVPVGGSNRNKRPWSPYPLPSPPARAIQLTCFLLFSAQERGVLAHFFTTFVKIFDSPSIHRR